eukprot:8498341-Alexandrium_andersonii.AAC.1
MVFPGDLRSRVCLATPGHSPGGPPGAGPRPGGLGHPGRHMGAVLASHRGCARTHARAAD